MNKVVAYLKSDSLKEFISILGNEYAVKLVCSPYDLFGEITRFGSDVLILDLPDEKDFDVIPNVHSIDPKLPVIATSSDISEEAQKRLRGYGLFYFFTFPADYEELKKALKDAVKFSQRKRSEEDMAMVCDLRGKTTDEETAQEKGKLSRRVFLDYALASMAAGMVLAVAGEIISFVIPPKTSGPNSFGTMVGDLRDLPWGKGKVVPYKDKAAIVINTRAGLVAYSALCTHLCCILQWDEQTGSIICPCHNGRFDVYGNVLSGPPPKALTSYKVAAIDEKIYLMDA